MTKHIPEGLHRIKDEEIERIGVDNLTEEDIKRMSQRQIKLFTKYIDHNVAKYDIGSGSKQRLMWLESALKTIKPPGKEGRMVVVLASKSFEKRKKTGKTKEYTRFSISVSAKNYVPFMQMLNKQFVEIADKDDAFELSHQMMKSLEAKYPEAFVRKQPMRKI